MPPEKKAKTDQDSLKQTSSKPENSKLTKTTKVNPAKVHQVESTNKLHKTNSIERHKIKKPIEDLKEVKKPSTVNAPSTKTKTPKSTFYFHSQKKHLPILINFENQITNKKTLF